MRNQMPEPARAQRGAQRRGRRRQAGKARDRGEAFDEAEFRAPATERQSRRQIAVETERVDRQDGPGRDPGVEAGVVGGEINLTAGQLRYRIAPNGMVKAPGRLAIRIAAGQTIERPPWSGAAVRAGFAHPLDLPDLHCCRAARIGYDAVLGLGMGERNRLATLREEVDDRRAAEGQRIRADGSLEFRQRAVEIGEDLQATSAGEQGLGLYLCEVDEQKFLGKGKIFAEKAEARKAAR